MSSTACGKTSLQPSWSNRESRGSMLSVVTQVSVSSWPICTWKEPGGSPPSIRVVSTSRALKPAPPATVAFTISTSPGHLSGYRSKSASSPAASPPVVHQLKISRSPVRPPGVGVTPSFFSSLHAVARPSNKVRDRAISSQNLHERIGGLLLRGARSSAPPANESRERFHGDLLACCRPYLEPPQHPDE